MARRGTRGRRRNNTSTSRVDGLTRPGIFISSVSWNLFWRPALCLIGGGVVALATFLANWAIFAITWLMSDTVNRSGLLLIEEWSWYMVIGLLFAAWAFQGEKDEGEQVPKFHAAAVNFNLQNPWRIYRTAGRYPWIGKRLLLDRSRVVKEPVTNADGYVYLGEIAIRIWNQSDAENSVVLSNVAKNTADLFSTLTIVIEQLDFIPWLKSSDPLLDVAERARSAYRTAVSFFLDRDNAAVKDVLANLMSRDTIITAFIKKQVGPHPAGSVVRDHADTPMLEVIHYRSGEREADLIARIATTREEFLTRLRDQADQDMVAAVSKAADGSPKLSELKISKSLNEVLEAVGSVLKRASVADVAMSQTVRDAANQAAAEADERAAQLASAETIKLARQKLILTKAQRENPSYRDATLIAAAQDNPGVKVIHVTGDGSNPFTQAAAVLGNQQQGDNR